ncbi:MAG: hypothetical protein E6G22_12595 [Actinobacteria bacterium]|nr:MAG: hypothetical protein E6G22_12595 [Actinomycetota bacterium]
MTAGGSSIPEVRRLLAVLAAGKRAAEIGTAFGLGAEALASTAREVVTVEVDPERAREARARSRVVRTSSSSSASGRSSFRRAGRSSSSSWTARAGSSTSRRRRGCSSSSPPAGSPSSTT